MATTTTKATTKTTSTYNNDFSAANAYRPDLDKFKPELQKAGQQTIDEYAGNRGYDSPYKYNDLLDNIYNPGAKAKLDQANAGTALAQNNYGQSVNAMNRSAIDAIRSETAGAVASGASRGLTDANVLKSILGLQQESVGDATELAQQYYQNYADYGADLAQALVDASDTSWQRQNAIDAETLQLFDRMQTAYDNKYTADAGLASSAYAADSAAFSNLLATLANRVLNEVTEATSVTEAPDATGGGGSYYSNYYNKDSGTNVKTRSTPLTDTSVATSEGLSDTPDKKAYGTVGAAQKAADALNGGAKTGWQAKYIVTEKREKNKDGNNSKYYAVVPNPNYKEHEYETWYTDNNNNPLSTKDKPHSANWR